MPDFQGAITARYDFGIGDKDAFVTTTAAYVGDFPGMLPNVPGQPGVPAATFDYTDAYTVVNAQAGISKNDWKVVAYIENLLDDSSITYVHPEGFLDSRYARVRPQTVGVRVSYVGTASVIHRAEALRRAGLGETDDDSDDSADAVRPELVCHRDDGDRRERRPARVGDLADRVPERA